MAESGTLVKGSERTVYASAEVRFFKGAPSRCGGILRAWLARAVEVAASLPIDPELGGRDDRLMRAAAALGARP